MKHLFNRGAHLIAGLCAIWSLAGCLLPDSGSESGTTIDMEPPAPAAPDPNSYVCNPMDGDSGPQSRTQGVRGTLYYLDSTQPHYNAVADYLAYGHLVSEVVLFFNQIYIPTRPFDRGFITHGGQTIMTTEGNTLYEYFAVRHEGRIQLGSKSPGLYQMAILSDDGAVFSMDFGSGYQEVINNDGDHPTRMGCAVAPVELTDADQIPYLLDYYQGPRYHISVMLMWRPWPMSAADPSQPASVQEASDAFCGVQGNSFYFDSTQNPPAPSANYQALLDRGWEPLAPENYELPAGDETNPCNEPAPIISDIVVTAISNNSITLDWKTDRPATSQVQYKKSGDANFGLTDPDGLMRTTHRVTVTGLSASTDYILFPTSASSSGLSTDGSQVTVRTRR